MIKSTKPVTFRKKSRFEQFFANSMPLLFNFLRSVTQHLKPSEQKNTTIRYFLHHVQFIYSAWGIRRVNVGRYN